MAAAAGDVRRAEDRRVEETVILVHGLLMTGLALAPMRHRLQAHGFAVRLFSYPSVRATPAESAARLRAAIDHTDGDVVHLLGHSLGGIVLLNLFRREAPARPGRVVFLGAPVRGSAVARVLAGRPITRGLLGRSTERGLLGDAPRWAGGRDLGVVAGTMPFGIGKALAALPLPHDGTVAVEETRLEGASAEWLVPVSHTGLVLSRRVADGVATFLRTGRFPPGDGADPAGA